MTVSLLVVAWGIAAVAVVTAVGRWCRAHPGTARPAPGRVAGPGGSPGTRVEDDRTPRPVRWSP